tara:strand:+ start:412 stop:741 length:330 start_codon:yes stop_codon:yes gene_type:complete
MQNSINNEIFEKANEWVVANQKVVIITVIQTWGSSPKPIGSKMIVNENGNFFGSVSAGCVESTVIKDSLEIIQKNILFKKKNFEVSDESAWKVGLSCGGKLTIYLEMID